MIPLALEFMRPERLLALAIIPLIGVLYLVLAGKQVRTTLSSRLRLVIPKDAAWKRHGAVLLALMSLASLIIAWAMPTDFTNKPRDRASIVVANGRFVSRNGWQFNNLTYLASPRSLWTGNKLAHTNAWTGSDGRRWRTECDTPVTGNNGCRTWTRSRVVQAKPVTAGGYAYSIESVEVFNNIVRFS